MSGDPLFGMVTPFLGPPRATPQGKPAKLPADALWAGPPVAQEKLVGRYHYEIGKPEAPTHSTTDVELKADGTMTWTTVTKFRDDRYVRRASGSWTWKDGVVTARLEKVEEGRPLPAGETPTYALRLAVDGKTLLMPDGARFVRQE